jgi:hypothetical protein
MTHPSPAVLRILSRTLTRKDAMRFVRPLFLVIVVALVSACLTEG